METIASDKWYLRSGKHHFGRSGVRYRPASRRSRLVKWRAKPGKLSRCCGIREGFSVVRPSPSLAPHSAQGHPNLHLHPLLMTVQHPRHLISSPILRIGSSLNLSPLSPSSRANRFRGLTQQKTHVSLNHKTVAFPFLRNSHRNPQLRRQPIYL